MKYFCEPKRHFAIDCMTFFSIFALQGENVFYVTTPSYIDLPSQLGTWTCKQDDPVNKPLS